MNQAMPSDDHIAQLMADAHVIAVWGLSNRPDSPSYEVASYQQSQGYKVIPVNPDVDSVLGHKAVANLSDVKEPVDIVDIFGHSADVANAVQQAIAHGVKTVWLQRGVRHPQAEEQARAAGLTVVTDRCFMSEHRRLLSSKPM